MLPSLCVLLALTSCGPTSRNAYPTAEFVQNFIDLNRRMDDSASAVAYDPRTKIMAVGRDSGRLELWDARTTDSRISREAHTVRIDHIVIGAEDGIVLTSSAGTTVMGLDPHGMPKVWNARSGELLLALPGEWHGGPLAEGPIAGFYLIASADELRVYDHARRTVTTPALDIQGQVTALASDKSSGLIAMGTSSGELLLLTLDATGEIPRLNVVNKTSTYHLEARTDILAVMLRDDGRRLITVNWLPKAQRREHPPIISGQQAEVVQWNTQNWQRERTYPVTLQTVHWASYTPGEAWLVLAGNESMRGKIELIDLQGGEAWRYKANTSHPVATLLPEIRTGIILQSGGATQIRYLDQH
ncbi:WD40 repeat domain-containing protein [Pseudoxanthomonas sp. UTMC 1351]|uniref:WD40 repeat domain-containing protein n=1 Tax=Pseudoxanthomonas sp. UTMC 1351 TaxID=2695853 RepID=UPI0034CFB6D1